MYLQPPSERRSADLPTRELRRLSFPPVTLASHRVPSVVTLPGSLASVVRHCQALVPCGALPRPRHLSSAGVTRLLRYYGALRPRPASVPVAHITDRVSRDVVSSTTTLQVKARCRRTSSKSVWILSLFEVQPYRLPARFADGAAKALVGILAPPAPIQFIVESRPVSGQDHAAANRP